MAFVGIYTLYAYFNHELEEKQKVFMLVFMAFWAYFIFKTGRAFLWRIYGKELILFDDEGISIKNDIRSYGKSIYTDVDEVNGFEGIQKNELSFFDSVSSTYWNTGGETLVLNKDGKDHFFAKELSEKESKSLRKLMFEHLKKIRK